MKLNQHTVKLSTLLSATLAVSACHDLVVKVQKKPKDANVSSVQTTSTGLNLTGTGDFLKQLDSLKGVAADFIVKQLAQDNYRAKVRASIRNYRQFLITKAAAQSSNIDAFYSGSDQCRKASLNFDMHDNDEFLGLILQTVVLAKIGEASATNLSSGLSQQIAAISQLILLDMGINIKGNVDVANADGLTTTTGTVSVSLSPIQGENLDAATTAADQDQVLTMAFARALGANSVGTFKATIDVTKRNDAGTIDTLEGGFLISRTQDQGQFDNQIKFNLGIKGGDITYARNIDFKQVAGNDHEIQVTDVYNPGLKTQTSYPSIIDLKAATQCKGTAADASGGKAATDLSTDNSEPIPTGSLPSTDTSATGTSTTGTTGTTGTTTGTGTVTSSTDSSNTGSNASGGKTGSTGSTGTTADSTGGKGTTANSTGGKGTTANSTGGKGTSGDSTGGKGASGSDSDKTSTLGSAGGGNTSGTTATGIPSQTPSQTVSQTPSQTVSQTPVK